MAKADERTTTLRRAIEKTLPAAVDKTDFWNKLERIKCNDVPPERLAVQCEEEAQRLDALVLPAGDAAVEQLKQQLSNELRSRAAAYRKISEAGGFRFLRQCSILWLWDSVGGDLGYTTPRKEREEERWLPHMPVIAYFQAAAEFVFDGKPPGPEAIKKVVIRYRRTDLKAAYRAALLHSAVFGTPFDVERQARLAVDDAKIFILRDGKLMTQAEADEDARRRREG